MKTAHDVYESIGTFLGKVYDAFDIRDIFLFGGMTAIWYGTYQYSPRLSYIVLGTLLTLLSLFMNRK